VSVIDLDTDFEHMNDNFGEMLATFNEAFFASDSKLTGPSVTPAPKEESKNVSTEDDKKKEEAKKEMIKNCGDMGISHKIAIEACNRVKELKMDLVLDEV
jgi:hypothetical protein